MPDEEAGEDSKFAVFCEADGHDKPLILLNLSWARMIDEVIVPYEKDDPFFIDGAPLTKKKCRRLKILRQRESVAGRIAEFHYIIRRGSDPQKSKILVDQYHIRIEALLRAGCDDVTTQTIRAFETEIKPKLSEYLPNRAELIGAAKTVFVESLKLLGGS